MKNMKKILVLFCCLAMSILVVGCEGTSGSGSSKKTIKVNVIKSQMKLTNVTYYDFLNDEKVSNYTSEKWDSVISNSLNSTEIWFTDKYGEARVMKVNTKLSSKPDKVRLYTNKSKSTYDTYSCEY